MKGFLAMGLLSPRLLLSLAKTVRDLHDAHRLTAPGIDEARVTKLIAEHNPLKPAI